MTTLLERIVTDLRNFSGESLEPGIAPTSKTSVRGGRSGTSGLLLETIEVLSRLLPQLLEELEDLGLGDVLSLPTHRPHRAVLSRRPADMDLHEGRLVPRVWSRRETIPAPPEDCLRWLLSLIDRLNDAVLEAKASHRRTVIQVRAAREGGRGWEIEDEPRLYARERRLRMAESALDRCRSQIASIAGTRLRPLPRSPTSFPSGRAWHHLRRLLHRIDEPWGAPAALMRHLLSGQADLPDLPFLYQRWCGLKVHESFERSGFESRGDLRAALFGAGIIRFVKADIAVDLWIDPRLIAGQKHRSGFTCVEGPEATPDMMLVAPGPEGPDAFVLDPTLATNEESLEQKGGYCDRLASYDLGFAAGVATSRRSPLRSWAIAPFRAPACKILDRATRQGRVGAVPLDPLDCDTGPLDAFLFDVIKHARAWARVEREKASGLWS